MVPEHCVLSWKGASSTLQLFQAAAPRAHAVLPQDAVAAHGPTCHQCSRDNLHLACIRQTCLDTKAIFGYLLKLLHLT